MKTFLQSAMLWLAVLQIATGNGLLELLAWQAGFLPLSPWQHRLKRRIIARCARLIEKHSEG